VSYRDLGSRSKTGITAHGDRCWETDISRRPPLDTHVRSWLDIERRNRRNAVIERARALL
jgi:hypothetical protein